MQNRKILDLLACLNATSYKEGLPWKGYRVYVPQKKTRGAVGYPLVILEKGEEIRISTPKESIEYLSFENKKQGDA